MPEHTPAPTPHRAVYGFAWFLLFKTLFFIYLIWAFVPNSLLEQTFGVTYLPSKYFAIHLPVLVMTALMFFAFLIYPAWNLSMTADADDIHTIWDKYTIRRCQFIVDNGRKCDQKIDFNMNSKNKWKVNKFCVLHSSSVNEQLKEQLKNLNDRKIADFCDCTDKTKCLLSKKPNFVKSLRAKNAVPSASDLDICDVNQILFRRK